MTDAEIRDFAQVAYRYATCTSPSNWPPGWKIRDDLIRRCSAILAADPSPAAAPSPETERCAPAKTCGAADHPVFTYPCVLAKGHEGPHDNGSGVPWASPAPRAPLAARIQTPEFRSTLAAAEEKLDATDSADHARAQAVAEASPLAPEAAPACGIPLDEHVKLAPGFYWGEHTPQGCGCRHPSGEGAVWTSPRHATAAHGGERAPWSAWCGSTRGTLVCERPVGHDGNHSAWTKGEHGVFGHTNWEPDPTPEAAPTTCTVEIVSGRYHDAFGVHERKKPCGLRLPCSLHGLAVSPTVPPAAAPGRSGGKP